MAAKTGSIVRMIAVRAAGDEDRDHALSETTREAILSSVTTDETDEAATGKDGRNRTVSRAVALKAILPDVEDVLTPGERTLFSEWLDKLIHIAR